jgi:hypothetical protein
MTVKRSRSITGWRQVKPEKAASKRRYPPFVAAKEAAPATPPETAGSERWESEGGTVAAPAGLPPAATAANPKIPR